MGKCLRDVNPGLGRWDFVFGFVCWCLGHFFVTQVALGSGGLSFSCVQALSHDLDVQREDELLEVIQRFNEDICGSRREELNRHMNARTFLNEDDIEGFLLRFNFVARTMEARLWGFFDHGDFELSQIDAELQHLSLALEKEQRRLEIEIDKRETFRAGQHLRERRFRDQEFLKRKAAAVKNYQEMMDEEGQFNPALLIPDREYGFIGLQDENRRIARIKFSREVVEFLISQKGSAARRLMAAIQNGFRGELAISGIKFLSGEVRSKKVIEVKIVGKDGASRLIGCFRNSILTILTVDKRHKSLANFQNLCKD